MTESDRRPVVSLAGVGKTFAVGSTTTVALSEIDLEIGSGEFVSLIGPSGCGKSTLLRTIGDLTPASSGLVLVNGKPAAQARLDREYGMVFQAPLLFDWRTVGENVQLPLELLGQDRATRARRADEMLDLVDSHGLRGTPPVSALGWHAAASGDRARPRLLAVAAPDGRAVRCPG